METDTWRERFIIQHLSHPDERYKHDYKGTEASTVELVADCAHLKKVTEGDGPGQMWEELFDLQDQIEPTVEQAVSTLRDQGLRKKVGEQPLHKELLLKKLIEGPGPETAPADTSPI